MSNKFLPEALILSVALHGAAAYSLYGRSVAPEHPGPDPEKLIQISYVEPRVEPKVVFKKELPPAPKLPVKIPTPARLASPPKVLSKSKVAGFSVARALPPAPSPASEMRSSADLLNDPQKGKAFSGYFAQVKDKIHRVLAKRYAAGESGEGKVVLYFVLNPNGELESVDALPRQSDAEKPMQRLAVECVKEAAPFGEFPKDLALERISFNVTIHFEDF